MIEDMGYPEGATPLDPDEMDGLKFSHVTTRGELDELEGSNIDSGLLWLSRQKNPDILADHFVRDLHKRLFGDVWKWAGSYRLTEKNIGIDPLYISVQLRTLLDNVQYWVDNETYPSMETAIRFHHLLVKIHPFPNGNGRHSRIMADTLLEKVFGEDHISWDGGYDLQKDNEGREQYISALRAADGGDYELLFDFLGYE